MAIATTRAKARHVNIGALPKVHSSHNSDCSDDFAQLEGHGAKEKSNEFIFGESDFTRRSHFAQEEIKSVENLLHFKHDMKTIAKAQLEHLKDKKKELKEWLVRLRYSMED